jgi:uncharacterized membrane protein YebE (DUF533 family)
MSFVFDKNDMLFISDQQRAAIITACVSAAMADGNINEAEIARMESEVVKVPWGMPRELIDEIAKQAVQNLAQIKDAKGVMDFITRTAATLPPGPIREKTLYLIASVMMSDKQVNDQEKIFLNAFAQAFAVPDDRLQAIAKELLGQ